QVPRDLGDGGAEARRVGLERGGLEALLAGRVQEGPAAAALAERQEGGPCLVGDGAGQAEDLPLGAAEECRGRQVNDLHEASPFWWGVSCRQRNQSCSS